MTAIDTTQRTTPDKGTDPAATAGTPWSGTPADRPSPDDPVVGELVDQLRTALLGHRPELRREVRQVLPEVLAAGGSQVDTGTPAGVHGDLGDSLPQARARTTERLHALARTGLPRMGFDPRHGGRAYDGHDDPAGSVILYEELGLADLSLMVKAGVQWGLFGRAVAALGTERHHARHLEAIMDGSLLGCFAMTESGHGSDVQRLRTTAVYDPATQEFVVHTPDAAARKDYIGNAAADGRMAVVFAQLETLGQRHGVHALLVPIRDADHRPCPGVTIGDCGHKGGLPGVDNGRLTFDRVRVPREALLDNFAQVAPDGTYTSAIESPGRRFFSMIGALVRGRISVGGVAGSSARVALTIAVRHGLARRQFPGPDGMETLLLDHPAHQRKLMPLLARSYGLALAQDQLTQLLARHGDERGTPAQGRRLEALAAGMKAVSTWHAVGTIQVCREACGGVGYLSENRLTVLRGDTDVFATFEGDNTVLLQLVARTLVAEHVADLTAGGRLATMARVARDRVMLAGERVAFTRPVGRTALLDPATQRRLLAARDRHLVASLARRLRAAGSGPDGAARAAAAQGHMLAAAKAHIDLFVLDALTAAVDRAPAPAAEVLARLRDLAVLSAVESDLGWFVVHGLLPRHTAAAVTPLVDRLSTRVRQDAAALVEAFDVPPAMLGVSVDAPA